MTCWRYFIPSASRAGLSSGGECFVMLFRIVLDLGCMGNAVVWKGEDDYIVLVVFVHTLAWICPHIVVRNSNLM